MKKMGVRICRIGGINIIVDYSWLIIFLLLTYSMAEMFFPEVHEGYERQWYWIMGASTAVLTFVSILIHELAHSWIAGKRGIKIINIRLFIFGGMAEAASEPGSGRDEFLIALAGPAVNILLGLMLVFVYVSTMEYASPVSTIVQWLAIVNFILAFFNLAPGFPLDGGRILRAFLWDHWNDMARATQVVSRIGDFLAIFLIVFGVLQIVFSRNLLFGIWCVCIGFLMKQASGGALRAAVTATKLEPHRRVTVRQVMKKNAVTVDWLITVNQFVDDYLHKYMFTQFPVQNRNEPVGMVTITEVGAVAVKLRDFKQIRDIMIPLEQVAGLHPEDDAESAFERMVDTGADCMPVIEDGKLAGIVLRRDIANYAQIKIALAK